MIGEILMVCAHCAVTIPDESQFCLACGQPVRATPVVPSARLQSTEWKDGFHFNLYGLFYLRQLRYAVGDMAFVKICRSSGLAEWEQQVPTQNLKRQFPFQHVARLQHATASQVGVARAHAIQVTCGEAMFHDALRDFGFLATAYRAIMGWFPVRMRIAHIMHLVAQTFDRFSDQTTASRRVDNHIEYRVATCGECMGPTWGGIGCGISEGMIRAAVTWVAPAQRVTVREIQCGHRGDTTCLFRIDVGEMTV